MLRDSYKGASRYLRSVGEGEILYSQTIHAH
jgi:hypothetical protein